MSCFLAVALRAQTPQQKHGIECHSDSRLHAQPSGAAAVPPVTSGDFRISKFLKLCTVNTRSLSRVSHASIKWFKKSLTHRTGKMATEKNTVSYPFLSVSGVL